MRNFSLMLLSILISGVVFSQEELLSELEEEVVLDSTVTSAFKGLKIVDIESTKLAAQKDFYFVIAHRFGSIKGGIDEFFGLDTSSIRFSLIYGFTDWLNFGVSRSSYNKVYDITSKYRFIQQQEHGFPLNVVGFSSIAINTGIDEDDYMNFEFKHRLTYLTQLMISRKITEKLSLQIVPILFHENFVENDMQDNTQYALGGGGRYKLSKFVTFNIDYAYHFNRASNSIFRNPLSIGVDIETGGHVFQLHLTNAQPMYDAGFLTNAAGDWSEGDIYFGFNLSRVF
ncbi:DUF5777 family beta-barrel protein [Urechidicola vernalis]|uniref:DUF5777 family beta-barrel protein n=1 Tax=Urechidicola vernalis TaxID=3075600 RepID=A0ABU2Y6M8_9FLAO|nr:DUF5777 family beta-barrel protein [Urechidicola sp. P050]MDT0553846.1 DUF5777 family beta-barrel protein [Urechidicola sp. P050]